MGGGGEEGAVGKGYGELFPEELAVIPIQWPRYLGEELPIRAFSSAPQFAPRSNGMFLRESLALFRVHPQNYGELFPEELAINGPRC